MAQSHRGLLLQAGAFGAAPHPRQLQTRTQRTPDGLHQGHQSRASRPHLALQHRQCSMIPIPTLFWKRRTRRKIMGRAGKAAPLVAAILAAAPPAISADLGEKLAPCLACHGADGQSELENVPSLGAQPAPYTVIQLFMFREKLRVAEPMNEMAKDLGDDDLQSIADFLAKQPAPKPPADAGDPARLEQARALTEQSHCNVCH